MVTSREAREYKAYVASRKWTTTVGGIFPAPQRVAVRFVWYRSRRSGDLDKRIGVLLDALQGVLYDNDSQITEIHARREDDRECPRVEVTITSLEG